MLKAIGKAVGAALTTALFAGFFQVQLASATELRAAAVAQAPVVDGRSSEWSGVPGVTVPLVGNGDVDEVELKAAVHGERIFMLVVWKDQTESRLHKPYKWDEGAGRYQTFGQLEDRFAISLAMAGEFSASKLSGAEFTADVWQWKASRSDPAGIAHDKMWRVSRSEFPKAESFTTKDGQTVWLTRQSDAGDRIYRPVKYRQKERDLMPRYEVNMSAGGSIADVSAKGVWKDGFWYLEMSRLLDTGHDDDAVIPASGDIAIAVAAFNDVDGADHSSSDVITLRTGSVSN